MVVEDKLLADNSSVAVKDNAVNLANALKNAVLLYKALIILGYAVYVREFLGRAQLSVKRVVVEPDEELNGLVGCVLEAIVNILIENTRARAERNAPSAVGEKRVRMVP